MRTPVVALAALWLAACAGVPTAPPPIHDYATREALLEDALGQIGRPYIYGGADAEGFDCSGLVYYVYQQIGIALPRTAAGQLHAGRAIPFSSAAPGDLVFYRIDGGMHVSIYVGNGKVVQAPASGQTVSVARVDTPYWRDHYVGTVRVLN